jgi:hypothetical protein
VGGRDEDRAAQGSAREIRDALLVLRVGVGVQEGDRQSLDLGIDAAAERGVHVFFVERGHHAPVGLEALRDFQPKAPRNQRRRLLIPKIIKLGRPDPAKLEHVPEPSGGDQRRLGAPSLEDGVGRDSRPVDHRAHLLRSDPSGAQQAS